MSEFEAFPKIGRLRREAIVTEKLDGTNAAIVVTAEGEVYAQSRTRIITPQDDNFGFAKWVEANKQELAAQLGEGRHFGEWWGSGIQRGYGLKEKRFSLFNRSRWTTESADCRCVEAPLCFVVPVLAELRTFNTTDINIVFEKLRTVGSIAVPGYMNPEGIVVFLPQTNTLFKVTYEYDDEGKGRAKEAANRARLAAKEANL